MPFDLPPIAKLAERILVDVEQAVRGFPRYHRYAIGADLRNQAAQVMRLCNRAWRDRAAQLQWTTDLVWAIDELKLSLQIGSKVHAFQTFAQFESLIVLGEELGRQAGGWKRQQQHPKGQNPAANAPRGVRPDTEYPSRLKSSGANP
jgi:hypothetical protein